MVFLTMISGCKIFSGSSVAKPDNIGEKQAAGTTSAITPSVQALPDEEPDPLELPGTYTGILPCADCEGIETTLLIMKDLTWKMTRKYLGKDEKTFEDKGALQWNDDKSAFRLSTSDEDPQWFFKEDRFLWVLDKTGNRIAGEFADQYRLERIH
jgi:uncharacterized lipoprotein NlpE involved in copper resistance